MKKYIFGTEYCGIYFTILEENLKSAEEKAERFFPNFKERVVLQTEVTDINVNGKLAKLIRSNYNA